MHTAADLMTANVPRARADETVKDALQALQHQQPDEASHLYLVDADSRLIGQVPIESLLGAEPETILKRLTGAPPIEVGPKDRARKVALIAVERHDADVAVVDQDRHFMGAIPIGKLLALLHEEHVDAWLRKGGIGKKHPSPAEPHETWRAFKARIPWLILGLGGGMLAGAVVGLFEESLKREVTLSFFLPLVVYIADAVGTQTETVLVRRMAYGEVKWHQQLVRESLLGVMIGTVIGGIAWAGLAIWGQDSLLAIAVGLSVLATAIEATLVASMLPIILAKLGADPALSSGPIATVLQDLLSVAIYLGIATLLLGI